MVEYLAFFHYEIPLQLLSSKNTDNVANFRVTESCMKASLPKI